MKKLFTILTFLGALYSCNEYLDVVPDNLATLDIAFHNRASAERYLTTCYSYVPLYGDPRSNPGLMAGNEVWYYSIDDNIYVQNLWAFGIANGLQNVVNPLNNYWDGEQYGRPLFQGIRDCNIFIEYVSDRNKVAGLSETERRRWLAEAKVLKAFYHYYLFQLYGPIPIMDENLPIDASSEQVRVSRSKVDDVVDYIVQTIDNCYTDLPPVIQMRAVELGRLTQAAALAIKAKTLVLAASPLFNGNTDYAQFLDHDGQPFINQQESTEKWERAAQACWDAIQSATIDGAHDLYDFATDASYNLPDVLRYGMSVRQAVTERFNKELIWSIGTQGTWGLQVTAMPLLDPDAGISQSNANAYCQAYHAPTLAVAERFYSSNGVPIEEDRDWVVNNDYYNRRYQTQSTNGYSEHLFLQNYETAILHFNREPRFYGSLGFDGSTWYGNGWKDPSGTRNYVLGKRNQRSGMTKAGLYSVTGYYAKKLIYYDNTYGSTISIKEYPFPIIRLADLYLMYAEALNEAHINGTVHPDVYTYIDLVRARSGLEGVQASWQSYSVYPEKPNSPLGMREIIRRERAIELALEGQHYFDVRRWKEAVNEFNQPVRGWSVDQESVPGYYNIINIYNQRFNQRDYLWPIKEYDLVVNTNLIQTKGW
ncbi:MAG: RagB/SusD family nutrient uptake outer membrane protein [Bacillota bacterium]|jgi:hypothetical protein